MARNFSGRVGIALALAALSLIAAAGCSARSRTPASPAQDATPSAGTATRDAVAELQQAATVAAVAAFRAVYEFTGAAPAGDSTGTIVIAAKPPKRLYSIDATDAGKKLEIAVIQDTTSGYFCARATTDTCVKTPALGSRGALIPPGFDVASIVEHFARPSSSTISPASGQRIAGREARCYAVNDPSAGVGTLCISPTDGLLLLLDGTFNGGKLTLKAREISNSPVDADFLPPYPIADDAPQ